MQMFIIKSTHSAIKAYTTHAFAGFVSVLPNEIAKFFDY